MFSWKSLKNFVNLVYMDTLIFVVVFQLTISLLERAKGRNCGPFASVFNSI